MCCQNKPGYGHHGEHGRESGGMHHGSGYCAMHHGGMHHGEEHHIGGSGMMEHRMGMGMGKGMGFRRFISRDEKIPRLEEYLKQLQAEAKGVEERIAELKKEA